MNEVWKQIKDYPEYYVSNKGRIKSLKTYKPKIISLDKLCCLEILS